MSTSQSTSTNQSGTSITKHRPAARTRLACAHVHLQLGGCTDYSTAILAFGYGLEGLTLFDRACFPFGQDTQLKTLSASDHKRRAKECLEEAVLHLREAKLTSQAEGLEGLLTYYSAMRENIVKGEPEHST